MKSVLLVIVCLVVTSCSGGLPPEFPAKDFALKSPVTGSEVTLASVKGKPVIMYWFTSW